MKIHLYILYLLLVVILIELFYKCSCFTVKEKFEVNTKLKPDKKPDSSKYILKTKVKSNKKKDNNNSSDHILKTEIKYDKLKIPSNYTLKTNINTNLSKDIDRTRYILKTNINTDRNNIDISKYILKTQIPTIDMSKYMLREQPRSYNPSTVGVYKKNNDITNIIEAESTNIHDEEHNISSVINNIKSHTNTNIDINNSNSSTSSSQQSNNSQENNTSHNIAHDHNSNISKLRTHCKI